jgi:transposase
MSDLFWLTDAQMARLEPFFPKSHGKPRVDDKRVLSGIIFINRNGLRWRDAPLEYGPPKALYNRWVRWSRKGIFARILIELAREGDRTDVLMIDATHLKAHRTASSLSLGRVDGFDQDEGCGKGDEGSEIPFRFFTTQSDPLETFQFPDGLFDARPSPVERFGEYLGDDPGVLSERDHRHRSVVTGDLSVLGAVISFVRHNCAWQNVRSKVQQSLEMRAVRGLPASQIKSDGKPLEVCFQMDFCAEPAA